MFHTKCCKPASISVEKYECNCQKFEGFARSLNKVSEKHDVNIFCIKLRFAFAATYSKATEKEVTLCAYVRADTDRIEMEMYVFTCGRKYICEGE